MNDNTIVRRSLNRKLTSQLDFFVADIFDALPKSDMASMEHPIYSITTRPDFETRTYTNGTATLTISPHPNHGLPSVHDKDFLIFAISQMVEGIKQGREPNRVVRMHAYDALTSIFRGTSGREYESFRAALRRMAGTTINTNVSSGGHTTEREFSLIDGWEIVRENKSGQMTELEITLNDWVFEAIRNHDVLTIHPEYFALRSPLARRLYEIARKHCGSQKTWSIGMEKLRIKVGAKSELKKFRASVRKVLEADSERQCIPGYDIVVMGIKDGDKIIVTRWPDPTEQMAMSFAQEAVVLPIATLEEAKRIAPRQDIYALESEFKAWVSGPDKRVPRNPSSAFLAFVRQRVEE